MDRSELEELLIKLKLETVSVDDIIDEIDKNFIKEEILFSDAIPTFLKNYFSAEGKDIVFLDEKIKSFVKKKEDFIFTSVKAEELASISITSNDVEIDINAGVIFSIKNKLPKSSKKIVIVSTYDIDIRLVNEISLVLSFIGVECSIYSNINISNIKGLSTPLNSYDMVVVVTNGNYNVLSLISEYVKLPIVGMVDYNFCSIKSDFNGVSFLNLGSSLSLIKSVIRTFRLI